MGPAPDNKIQIVGVSLVLFCVSLFLTAYSSRNPEVARTGFAIVAEAARPAAVAKTGVVEGVESLWQRYVALQNVYDDNLRLTEELNRAQLENSRLRESKVENMRLREMLGMVREVRLNGLTANVIGQDPSNWTHAILIDRGSQQGVEPGMAVVDPNGVVGQIVSTSPNASRVLLVTDISSSVDALVQRTRARGIVDGAGAQTPRFRFVLAGQELRKNDLVVTSGMDGVYPKGLVIGRIASVRGRGGGLFQGVEVEPSVNFSKIESVLVVSDSSEADPEGFVRWAELKAHPHVPSHPKPAESEALATVPQSAPEQVAASEGAATPRAQPRAEAIPTLSAPTPTPAISKTPTSSKPARPAPRVTAITLSSPSRSSSRQPPTVKTAAPGRGAVATGGNQGAPRAEAEGRQ